MFTSEHVTTTSHHEKRIGGLVTDESTVLSD